MFSVSVILLLLALAGLFGAPTVYRLLQRSPRLHDGMDGLVLVVVGGLLVLHLVPEALSEGGLAAAIGLLVGLGLPVFLEHGGGALAHRAHGVTLLVALVGLVVHEAIDGVALSLAGGAAPVTLGTAVVLHRLPMGLLLWSRARLTWGRGRAWGLLGLLGAANIAGFAAGQPLLSVLEGGGVAVFSALVSGSLAHVLVHRPERPREGRAATARLAEGLGALLGAALLVLVGGGLHLSAAYAERLLALGLLVAPLLLLGYALAGLLAETLPAGALGWSGRGGPLSQAARGVALGLPMPACACGPDGLHAGLLRAGARPVAAAALAVAAPGLAVEALALSVPLLGVELTVARLGGAALIALFAGWVVRSRPGPAPVAIEGLSAPAPPTRVARVLRTGFVEVVDETAPWVLIGLAVAAAVEPGALGPAMAGLPLGVELVIFGLLGMPVYVCAAGSTPLAAAALIAGVSPGAALAFVLTGPAISLAQLSDFRLRHGRRAARLQGLLALVAAVGLGALVNLLLGPSWGLAFAPSRAAGVVAWAALATLGLAYAASLLRLGPVAFARQVLGLETHAHEHEHGHEHGVEPTEGHVEAAPGEAGSPHFHVRLGVKRDGL